MLLSLIADTFTYPTIVRYKQHDTAPHDAIRDGDLYRSNHIHLAYLLKGTIPSIHEGDDVVGMNFSCRGLPVVAVANGIVTNSEKVPNSTWDNLIDIEHTLPDGRKVYSKYAHLQDRKVSKGDPVVIGQLIGHIGNASGQLAYHLHFAICVTDLLLHDPRNWPSTRHTPEQAHAIISANYVDPLFFIDSYQSPTLEVLPTNEESTVGSKVMYVNTGTDTLRLRAQPSTLATTLSKHASGTAVTAFDLTAIDKNDNAFQLVKLGSVYGWMAAKYLSLEKP